MKLNSDLWVLTETHSSILLPGYTSLSSKQDPDYHFNGESCAKIWSRYPITKIDKIDQIFSVCADVQSPMGPVLVYGTVITYGFDGVSAGLARPWELHRKAVQQLTAEWQKLQEQFPGHLICIAGDFNMNLDGRRWYGVNDAKNTVKCVLDGAGLQCATEEDLHHPIT